MQHNRIINKRGFGKIRLYASDAILTASSNAFGQSHIKKQSY